MLLTCLLRQIKSLICKSGALMEKALRCWRRGGRERAEEGDGGIAFGCEERVAARILKWKEKKNDGKDRS